MIPMCRSIFAFVAKQRNNKTRKKKLQRTIFECRQFLGSTIDETIFSFFKTTINLGQKMTKINAE
jgi:hypothetical protein